MLQLVCFQGGRGNLSIHGVKANTFLIMVTNNLFSPIYKYKSWGDGIGERFQRSDGGAFVFIKLFNTFMKISIWRQATGNQYVW